LGLTVSKRKANIKSSSKLLSKTVSLIFIIFRSLLVEKYSVSVIFTLTETRNNSKINLESLVERNTNTANKAIVLK